MYSASVQIKASQQALLPLECLRNSNIFHVKEGLFLILFLYQRNDILSKIRANVSGQCHRVLRVLKTGIIFQTGHENDKITSAFPV